jgi:hypothetical protein
MKNDVLATMAAEIDECVGLLRPHYPEALENQLRAIAMDMRAERYQVGHWPSDEEIAEAKGKAEAKAAAEMQVVSDREVAPWPTLLFPAT